MKKIILLLLFYSLLYPKNIIVYYSRIEPLNFCDKNLSKVRLGYELNKTVGEQRVKEIISSAKKVLKKGRCNFGSSFAIPKVYYKNKVFYKKKIPYKIEEFQGCEYPAYTMYFNDKGQAIKQTKYPEKILLEIKYINDKIIIKHMEDNSTYICPKNFKTDVEEFY